MSIPDYDRVGYDPKRRWPPRKRQESPPWLARPWRLREFLLLAVLFSLPFAAGFLGLSAALVVELVMLAFVGVAAVIALRGDWQLFGPQFYYEVVTLARRGRSIYVRIIYVTILFLGQAFIYYSFFGEGPRGFEVGPTIDRRELVNFAQRFFGVVVLLQNLAVVLLTPVYVATAITEEREKGTLDMMFTSHLTDREIVLGKLAGRLMHIGGVLLAGLPVLSLSQFLGGVDMMVLLANFAVTALNLLTAGSLCIMISVHARKAIAAVLISYAVLVPFAGCFGSATFRLMLSQQGVGQSGDAFSLEMLGAYAIIHAMISATCLAVAVNSLRTPRQSDFSFRQVMFPDDYAPGGPTDGPGISIEEKIVLRRPLRPLPPITEQPLVWKEMNLGGKIFAYSPVFWVPLASLLLPLVMMFLTALLTFGRDPGNNVMELNGTLSRILLLLLAGQFLLGVANRACASVAQERQLGTLDALLTLPVDDRDILSAKWLAGLVKGWGWGMFYLPILLIALIAGSIYWIGGLLLLMAPVVHGAFLASLGLLLSIVSPTVLVAQTRMALFFLTTVGLYIAELMLGSHGVLGLLNSLLNPIKCWISLTSSRTDATLLKSTDMVVDMFNLLACAAMAGLLWAAARHLFMLERFRRR